MTSILRRTVIATLLAVWSFPAAASAGNQTGTLAPISSASTRTSPTPGGAAATPSRGAGAASSAGEAQQYAARERQAQGLQDFQGGEGYIYIGGGVLTVVLLVLLILVLV